MNSYTLWMGDIESWMDERYVKQIYSKLRIEVSSVKLMKDRQSGNKLGNIAELNCLGYCFVEFKTAEEAQYVLNRFNGKLIDDTKRTFKLNWSSYNKENFEEYSLYVGNLDPRISEAEIKNFFLSFYSSVKSVKLITFNGSRISKGYGFVKFLNAEEYKRSLREMNGKLFCNRPLIVNQACNRKNNTHGYNSPANANSIQTKSIESNQSSPVNAEKSLQHEKSNYTETNNIYVENLFDNQKLIEWLRKIDIYKSKHDLIVSL